jgi:hypothetical protein
MAENSSSSVSLQCTQNEGYALLSNFMLILMRVVVPFAIMILSNVILIYNLKKVLKNKLINPIKKEQPICLNFIYHKKR